MGSAISILRGGAGTEALEGGDHIKSKEQSLFRGKLVMEVDVYIGHLDSPENGNFKWEGGDWNGNIPHRISPQFFPNAHDAFQKILDWTHSSDWEGKQLDWGAWGIKMRKQDLLAFIDACEKGNVFESIKYDRIRDFVKDELNDDTTYVLVGFETCYDLPD